MLTLVITSINMRRHISIRLFLGTGEHKFGVLIYHHVIKLQDTEYTLKISVLSNASFSYYKIKVSFTMSRWGNSSIFKCELLSSRIHGNFSHRLKVNYLLVHQSSTAKIRTEKVQEQEQITAKTSD